MSQRNRINKNNTSGALGVNWSKEKNKWHAKIGLNYRRLHLGYFSDINSAINAYEKAKAKYKNQYKVKKRNSK